MKQITREFKYLALISTFLVFPHTAFAEFSDVPPTHNYYNAVTALEEAGIIKGYSDNTFQPDQLIKRSEFMKIVFNHAGYSPREGFYTNAYTDVPDGSWFAPYVKKALDLNLIKINPDLPKFFPKQPVSRIESLQLILPLEGVPAPLSSDTSGIIFEDIEPDSLYSHYVRAAQKAGIFIPEEQPYFFPLKNLTRGETAELLYRAQIYRQILGDPIEIPASELIKPISSGADAPNFINNPKFPIFLSVWTKINTESLYKDDIDPDELVYGAISGMVEKLPDKHATFQNPNEALELLNDLDGKYEGIGTVLDFFEDEFLIITVMKGSPAETAGLKAGDVILKVDGENVSDMTITELINNIKGPSGSTVKITIRRNNETKTLSIQREEIALDTVFFEGGFEVPGNIGYISIYQFTGSTAYDFKQLLDQTLANNPKGLIIDLRDNPGGHVNAAYEVLDLFIDQGETLAKMDFSGLLRDASSNGPGNIPDKIRVVVLVNGNTASAAEIVAGALQDHGAATLIGEPTYGKGTMQEVNTYNDGSLFKFTIAEWFTPLNNKVDQKGLTPDILVNRTKDDVLGKTDSQLERAILELQKQFR